jgi:hypothetical protein
LTPCPNSWGKQTFESWLIGKQNDEQSINWCHISGIAFDPSRLEYSPLPQE